MSAKCAGPGWRAAALMAAVGLLALAGCAYDDYPDGGYYDYPPTYYGYPPGYGYGYGYYGYYPGWYRRGWYDHDHDDDHHHDHDGDHDGGNHGGNAGGGPPPSGGGPSGPSRFPPAHAGNQPMAPAPPSQPRPPFRRDRASGGMSAPSSPAVIPPPPFKR